MNNMTLPDNMKKPFLGDHIPRDRHPPRSTILNGAVNSLSRFLSWAGARDSAVYLRLVGFSQPGGISSIVQLTESITGYEWSI
jgi:hypothetical protein